MGDQNTIVIGLTGQTGAGKSTLSRMFFDKGVMIIDADSVARDTMENSKTVLMDLVIEFSTEVINPDATLNREQLAKVCFSDKKKLKRLNEITYPHIIRAIMRKINTARAERCPIVLLDAPTLFESGLDEQCDRVIAVVAGRDARLRRILRRDTITEEAALLRINAQPDDQFYVSRADDIVDNDDNFETLRLAFNELFGKLETMARRGTCGPKKQHVPITQDAAPFAEPVKEGEFEELSEQ